MNAIDASRARVREAGGPALLERLDHLDATRTQRTERPAAPNPPLRDDARDADVVIAGGGLWSLLAPLLAKRGLRVVVVERARVGQGHREWNASRGELDALVTCGLFDADALRRMIVTSYDHGICRFAGGGVHPVAGVLDHAVDAGLLLSEARDIAEKEGVVFLDGHSVLSHAASPHGVRVRVADANGEVELTARVLVDARGAASPYAAADLVCPTVGGVLEGLREGDGPDEINPRVGEILATVDGVEEGRQHVWEAFPGRPGQTTVYLFFYARASEPVSLASLYARFFARLGGYKGGDARLIRPTFGFIPGWSRLAPPPRADDPSVVLVGDAAARHSALTYCGFGAALRSLDGAADAVTRLVQSGQAGPACVVDDAPIHALTGILAHVMASRRFVDEELNQLLDVAFDTLHSLGNSTYAELLRDEISTRDFILFLRRIASRYPPVWSHIFRAIGPRMATRWSVSLARSVWVAKS